MTALFPTPTTSSAMRRRLSPTLSLTAGVSPTLSRSPRSSLPCQRRTPTALVLLSSPRAHYPQSLPLPRRTVRSRLSSSVCARSRRTRSTTLTVPGKSTVTIQTAIYRTLVLTASSSDAFAGGFVAGIVEGKSLEESIDIGQWLASLSIQELGPS